MLNGDLVIEDLHVSIEGKEILRGINLTINKGEVHALMGPNGSGKSTLAYALAGHPKYIITKGKVTLKGENLLTMSADKRARLGLFLAFQYPSAVPGVSVANFLRSAVRAKIKGSSISGGGNGSVTALADAEGEAVQRSAFASMATNSTDAPTSTATASVVRRPGAMAGSDSGFNPREFRKTLKEKMALLKMDDSFSGRSLNDGFSGGEKKRAEILQMSLLKPEIAILDEPDSGLDIDAIRIVAEGVNALLGPDLGVLIITHYQRILNYISPDHVHVMLNGRIVESGGAELVQELEKNGYEGIRARYAEDSIDPTNYQERKDNENGSADSAAPAA
ncbi:MAG: Fe-S cluster assembly ATPase SufC [Candidatus Chloroheliales bacterium]|nr:MAG: Fe-S cluster assembly ATPase SufC [Chloroflexota bacterium]